MLRLRSDCDKPPKPHGWNSYIPGVIVLCVETTTLCIVWTGEHWELFIGDRNVTPEEWKPTTEWAAKRELLGLYREELAATMKMIEEEEKALNESDSSN